MMRPEEQARIRMMERPRTINDPTGVEKLLPKRRKYAFTVEEIREHDRKLRALKESHAAFVADQQSKGIYVNPDLFEYTKEQEYLSLDRQRQLNPVSQTGATPSAATPPRANPNSYYDVLQPRSPPVQSRPKPAAQPQPQPQAIFQPQPQFQYQPQYQPQPQPQYQVVQPGQPPQPYYQPQPTSYYGNPQVQYANQTNQPASEKKDFMTGMRDFLKTLKFNPNPSQQKRPPQQPMMAAQQPYMPQPNPNSDQIPVPAVSTFGLSPYAAMGTQAGYAQPSSLSYQFPGYASTSAYPGQVMMTQPGVDPYAQTYLGH